MSKKCIFAKTEITSTLKILEKEYLKLYLVSTPQSTNLMKLYSKMAIVTLGSWIEDGMKELAQISIIQLGEVKTQDKIIKMVSEIYGFNYSSNFSTSIVYSFGPHGLEFIESSIGSKNLAKLSSEFGNLKSWRDAAAHSYSAVINCDPSRAIQVFDDIFPILKKIEKCAREYRDRHL